MELKKINQHDEILRKECNPVKVRNKKELNDIVSRIYPAMVRLMKENDGCGIASTQIGESKRYFVAKLKDGLHFFINPEIVKESKETNIEEEGCLSVPNYHGLVERPTEITVKYYDYEKDKKMTKIYKDWDARIILHENNHLDGVLYIDIAKEVSEKEIEVAVAK